MSTQQEPNWVRLLSSAIVGGCAVLAAMVPLYCSKQKSLETQVARNRDDQSELEALKQQVAKLESRIAQRDTQGNSPGDRPNPGQASSGTRDDQHIVAPQSTGPAGASDTGDPATVSSQPAKQGSPGSAKRVTENGFTFELKGCTPSGSELTCDLSITNTRDETTLYLSNTRIIDTSGVERSCRQMSLGAPNKTMGTIPSETTLSAQFEFAGITPDVRGLQVLEISFYASRSGDRRSLASFRNLSF